VVAAQDEVGLVLLRAGVRAAVDGEVPTQQPGRQLHQPVGVVELLRLPLEHAEERLASGHRPVRGDVDQHAPKPPGHTGFVSLHVRFFVQPQHFSLSVADAVGQFVVVVLDGSVPALCLHPRPVAGEHHRGPEVRFVQPPAHRMTEQSFGVLGDEGEPARHGVGLPDHHREVVQERAQPM
jgi:hypothetical protein